MAAPQMNYVLRHLRKAALLGERAPLSDGELLRRFLDFRDEVAFETLVQRHGPMVLGVCRRILGNYHDAEDAFQATFLILVRRAAALAGREVVGDWLHGVAYRTALKMRAAEARRRAKERAMPRPEAREDDPGPDLQVLLDRELNGLPAKYRVPIVLCDLEGKTRREAARQLGWPEGTLSGRLSRGRALLARRLARRGLMLSGGTLAAGLAQEAAPACVPAPLVQQTVLAATALAAGQLAAVGLVSAEVASLMEGVLKTMLVSKLKIAAGVLLLGLVALAAGAGGWVTGAAEPPRAPSEPVIVPAERPVEEAKNHATLDPAQVLDLLPGGPMPVPFLVRMEPNGMITVWRKDAFYQPIEETVPGNAPAITYHRTESTVAQRFDTAQVKLKVYNAQGKKVELKALPRLLNKVTVAMQIPDGQPDPRLLRLFREGTLFFVLPGLSAPHPPPAAEEVGQRPAPPIPARPRTAKQPPTLWFKTKRITIHYSTKVADPPGVNPVVELWHTQDGRTWQKSAEKTNLTQPFILEVTDEGIHGFLVVVRSGDMLSRERPREGDPPEVWVEVDVTPPVVQLFGPELESGAEGDQVLITWNAQDKNLVSKPVSLYFADAAKTAWTPIATGLHNDGRYLWDPPSNLPASARIRIQVTDRAGNIGIAERSFRRGPVTRPEGTIDRVEPADGPPH